jgi:predicted RNase H-like HicB family nuclease
MEYAYPVCFYPDDEGITVDVPDLLGCVTEGDTLTEALFMAQDAMEGWLYISLLEGEELPEPTPINEVHADEYENGFVSYVRADIDGFIKKHNLTPIPKSKPVSA